MLSSLSSPIRLYIPYILLLYWAMAEPQSAKKTLYILRSVLIEEKNDLTRTKEEIQAIQESSYLQDKVITLFQDAGYNAIPLDIPLINYKQFLMKHLPPPENHPLIINTCDSFGIDGKIEARTASSYLDQFLYEYSGANSEFDIKSNSKILAKKLFLEAKVPTLPYVYFTTYQPSIQKKIEEAKLNYPLILKATHTFSGVGTKFPLCNYDEVEKAIKEGVKSFFGMFVEEYLKGPEYTCFIYDGKDGPVALNPLCFEDLHRLNESGVPAYNKNPVTDKELNERIKEISIKAYKAVAGHSYARVDLRVRESTGEIFVLEVNSSPLLSTKYVALIMEFSKIELSEVLRRIVEQQQVHA
jgi:D-alanine-D-alanine ligase-like ATP-grasp enzyme